MLFVPIGRPVKRTACVQYKQPSSARILNVKHFYAPRTCSGATNANKCFATAATPITRNKSTARNRRVGRLIRTKNDATLSHSSVVALGLRPSVDDLS